jgi:Ca2+-binding RTX toxin-like protein
VDPSFGSATGARLPVPDSSASTVGEGIALLPHGTIAITGDSGGTGGKAFVGELHRDGTPNAGMGPHGLKALRRTETMVGAAAGTDGRILAAGNLIGSGNVLYRLQGDLKPPTCGGKTATIVGTSAADRLVGTKHADVIAGLGGGDTVTGLGKGDVICGGAGRDHLSGGAGADHLYGGRGRDTLRGGPGRDVIRQ